MTQRVLIVPDGAAEPWPAGGATSLERATTLALDRLCARGAVRRVATTPDGLPAGSETGLPLLLGWRPDGVVSRGRIEAAARRIEPAPGDAVHRVDVRTADGRALPELAGPARDLLAAANRGHEVHRLDGHRLLVIGPGEPDLPPNADLAAAAGLGPGPGGTLAGPARDAPRLQLWADGETPLPILDDDTVVVCARRSTAAGVAELLGARTVHPGGATGMPGTDVAAKGRAAASLLRDGAETVVVHVGSPDEAAHARDPRGKAAELSKIDQVLIAPLAGVALDLGALFAVCPDHGTDPATGRHDGAPVPAVLFGARVSRSGPGRLTEAACADEPVVAGPWDLA